MAAWSQVFDDGRVLEHARRRARGLLIAFALVSGALVSAAPVLALRSGGHSGAVALGCGVLLSLAASCVLVGLSREHRRAWRFEVSALGIAAYDAAGRRSALLWREVTRVDLSDDGLSVTGRNREGRRIAFRAPVSMPTFDALARHVVACAHAHRRLLSVDGRPVSTLSLERLEERSEETTRPGGSAEAAG